MAINAKQPFVYTLKHKMLGDQSTFTTISNNGVTKLTVNSTYTLAAPEVSSLKTIYRTAAMTTANTLIAPSSGCSFDGNGGTQVLSLQPTTAAGGNDISVTLIGESTSHSIPAAAHAVDPHPYTVEFGLRATSATTGFKIVTGASVAAIAVGKFASD